MRRRVILEAFDDSFAFSVGSVRATSLRRRSSIDEAVCLAFSTERSIWRRDWLALAAPLMKSFVSAVTYSYGYLAWISMN